MSRSDFFGARWGRDQGFDYDYRRKRNSAIFEEPESDNEDYYDRQSLEDFIASDGEDVGVVEREKKGKNKEKRKGKRQEQKEQEISKEGKLLFDDFLENCRNGLEEEKSPSVKKESLSQCELKRLRFNWSSDSSSGSEEEGGENVEGEESSSSDWLKPRSQRATPGKGKGKGIVVLSSSDSEDDAETKNPDDLEDVAFWPKTPPQVGLRRSRSTSHSFETPSPRKFAYASVPKNATPRRSVPRRLSYLDSRKKESETIAEGRDTEDDPNDDICHKCNLAGDLICCEGCPKSFHLACIGLSTVPRDDFYCGECEQKRRSSELVLDSDSEEDKKPLALLSKSPRRSVPSSEKHEASTSKLVENGGDTEDDPNDDICDKCNLAGDLICCDGCPKSFHLACIGLSTVPDDDFYCGHCEQKRRSSELVLDSESEEDEEPPELLSKRPRRSVLPSSEKHKASREDDPNDDICGKCEQGGDLICCEGCPKSFHLACIGLSTVPRGDFYCEECLQSLSKRRKSSRGKRRK